MGSVIGAGFASGQEQLQFFVALGDAGVGALIVAGLVLAVGGGLFLHMAYAYRTSSHRALLQAVWPGPMAKLFDLFLNVALLMSLSVMMAGGGALVGTLLPVPPWVGSVVLGLCAAFIVALGADRMLRVNTVLTALLTLSALIVVVRVVSTYGMGSFSSNPLGSGAVASSWVPSSWFGAGGLYAAYNLTYCFCLFGALGSSVRDRRAAWRGALLGGGALGLLGAGISMALASAREVTDLGELPMLAAAALVGPALHAVYILVIWLAMVTTAIAATFTLAQRAAQWLRARPGSLGLAVVVAAFPLAVVGFGTLVGTAYPLTGYVGFICLAGTLFRWRDPRRPLRFPRRKR